jgi:serine protease
MLGVAGGLVCPALAAPTPGMAGGEWLLLPVDDGAHARLLQAEAPGPLSAALPGDPRFPELGRVLRLQAGAPDARKWLEAARAAGELDWYEPAPLRRVDRLPDDPRWPELWALPRIAAPAAWDLHVGDGEVLVAVVDTGVDLQHPDLAPALWTNPAEAGGQPGQDDDGNGWIDDLQGWDVLDEDPDPSPAPGDQSHGTHVAGTAACTTDNGIGVACPAWRAALLPVRAGHGNLISRGAEGIWYAARTGARVINCSWGGSGYSHFEQAVITAALELGSLVVASAGNDGSSRPHYPAAYPGVLGVAATAPDDSKLPGSQYGWWVDLCAPGSGILSTMIGGGYGLKSGTSMATPLVASLAALLADARPGWGPEALREQLIASADPVDAVNPGYAGQLGGGRIHALRCLEEEVRALALAGWTLMDEGQDGRLDPGEEAELLPVLRSALGSFAALSGSLVFPEGGAIPLQTTTGFPALAGPGAEGAAGTPLRFRVPVDAAPGSQLLLRLELSDGAEPAPRALQWTLPVAPLYVTVGGELALSLSGRGELGYYDFEANQARGQGLTWPPGSPSHLYHGSLLLALEGGEVLQMASYLIGQAGDFSPLPGGELRLVSGPDGDLATAGFQAPGHPGLQVDLEARSSTLPQRDNILLLRFTLRGDGVPLVLRPALWMDFDAGGTWSNDEGGWEADLQLAWQGDAGGPLLGLLPLDGPAQAFRLCRYDEWISGGLSDAELALWLSQGFSQTASDGPDDWQCLLGLAEAPLIQTRHADFAVLAAADLPALRAAALQARLWHEAVPVTGPLQPVDFRLRAAPNPFNPQTWISLQLPWAATLSWSVHDLLGRRLQGADGLSLAAGEHGFRLDLPDQPSGPLWLVVEAGGRRQVLPLLRIK